MKQKNNTNEWIIYIIIGILIGILIGLSIFESIDKDVVDIRDYEIISTNIDGTITKINYEEVLPGNMYLISGEYNESGFVYIEEVIFDNQDKTIKVKLKELNFKEKIK